MEGAATKENKLYQWGVGEAWSYRRKAFARMADVLAERRGNSGRIAKEMHTAIYALEPEATRHLNQLETPPM